MKRFTLSVVMTAVLGLAAYTLADAHNDRRELRDREAGLTGFVQERGRPGSGGPGRRGGGPMFALRGLDLTEEQQTRIKAIHDAERESQPGPPADGAVHRLLQEAVFAETPDAGQIAALQQQLVQAQSARLAKRIAIEQQIAQILTPEQRAQVRERRARQQGPRAQ
jgi:Spy/CpxP family protein refolding chaperone